MSYFAAAAVRDSTGWVAEEIDLSGVADVDEVADRLRDVAPDADLSLLFVEADDAYLVILRLDAGEDLRIFGSDSAFADESRLGEVLIGDLKAPLVEVEEPADEEEQPEEEEIEAPVIDPDADPVGEVDLLADLGVSAQQLLNLSAKEGMLPADVTAEICQIVGCGDVIEELREA
ncbi:MAG TPA: tRNA adenosine deaminase-associated protein [Micromonospora sp.]|nr:tRNA adenosine deaminase-associated protein [Micromonospora sp.]